MRWLLRLLRRILLPTRYHQNSSNNAANAPQQINNYLQWLEDHGGTRITTTRVLGGRITDDNVIFTREHLETEDDRGNSVQLEAYEARQCSFGHLIDQDVRATSTCRICGAILCSTGAGSTEACSAQCFNCGLVCCARHRATYTLNDGHTITYCYRCSWKHWWRKFWGLYP